MNNMGAAQKISTELLTTSRETLDWDIFWPVFVSLESGKSSHMPDAVRLNNCPRQVRQFTASGAEMGST